MAVPIDDPQVVIYTVLDEPNIASQEDGTYTMGLATDILKEILPYLGIFPTEEITEEEKDSLGIQIEKEEVQKETEIQYVYDAYGNPVYDEETWQPLTEIIEIKPEEEQLNLYGNVAPPEQHEETGVDENWSDGMTNEELMVGTW